ncbi:recombination mediator RecR [Amaricoccus sp.]|uniref:recombination mediator RecR n=1 Tax=Amaricoccus sp. TaxID=1872485 RepID=UPI00261EA81E|nr:recombination mediator RecR [Amaricoccus sp.]HRO12475.1 recombination mediator RecR [Amaricoccus sp.]
MAGAGEASIERLIALMARLPGLGPRSARRAVLAMVRRREVLLEPLAGALAEVAASVRECPRCGNIATGDLCGICADPRRETGEICVVETVADLWAMERGGAFRGRYHVLGGILSALDGVGPEALRIPELVARVAAEGTREVILALNATVDGQTTAHYIAGELAPLGVTVTSLAKGVPIGGELDYLDDGTIGAALLARRAI